MTEKELLSDRITRLNNELVDQQKIHYISFGVVAAVSAVWIYIQYQYWPMVLASLLYNQVSFSILRSIQRNLLQKLRFQYHMLNLGGVKTDGTHRNEETIQDKPTDTGTSV